MFDFFHGREDRLDLDRSKSTFSSLDNSSQIGANTCTNSSGTVTRFCSFGSVLFFMFIFSFLRCVWALRLSLLPTHRYPHIIAESVRKGQEFGIGSVLVPIRAGFRCMQVNGVCGEQKSTVLTHSFEAHYSSVFPFFATLHFLSTTFVC